MNHDVIPETAADAVFAWDHELCVYTASMGGLGPGYEQCIQILAFELMRAALATGFPLGPWPEDRESKEFKERKRLWDACSEPIISLLDKLNGFSGAQVGAAQNLAQNGLARGWRATLRGLPEKRLIQVSKTWPKTGLEST